MQIKINSFLKNSNKKIITAIFFIATIIILLSKITIFEVHGVSMEPTLFEGNLILINKHFLKNKFKKGDVIIFQRGSDPKYIIKRILGCPYDTVVYGSGFERDTVVLGRNDYFIEGDNKDNSIDSRKYGPINRNQIIGEKIMVIK